MRATTTVLELSPRARGVLRLVALFGPVPFVDLERLVPHFLQELAQRRSRHRLLYLVLEQLERQGFITSIRPAGFHASLYALRPRGIALVRDFELASPHDDELKLFLLAPRHNLLVRRIRIEFVLARHLPGGPIAHLGWNDHARYPVRINGRDAAVEPDCVLTLLLRDRSSRTVMLEVDRGTERGGRWAEKMRKTGPVLGALGPDDRLLVVTPGAGRLRALRQETTSQLPGELLARTRWIKLDCMTAENILGANFLKAGRDPERVPLVDWSKPPR